MNWDNIKRGARQRIRFRKWLHYYGFHYTSTVGLNTQQLIKMLQD